MGRPAVCNRQTQAGSSAEPIAGAARDGGAAAAAVAAGSGGGPRRLQVCAHQTTRYGRSCAAAAESSRAERSALASQGSRSRRGATWRCWRTAIAAEQASGGPEQQSTVAEMGKRAHRRRRQVPPPSAACSLRRAAACPSLALTSAPGTGLHLHSCTHERKASRTRGLGAGHGRRPALRSPHRVAGAARRRACTRGAAAAPVLAPRPHGPHTPRLPCPFFKP